jgi:hypothetical protein
MSARPVIKGTFNLTPEFLNALAKKGKNERGKYDVDVAMWYDDKRANERAPHLSGPASIPGDDNGVKSYGKCWLNVENGEPVAAPASSTAAAADTGDDLF